MPTSRPQTAFLAAALVLLVLPVLVMLGLSALGIAAHLGMMDQTGFAPRSYDALMSIVSGYPDLAVLRLHEHGRA